jgi:carboxylesterase type B
MMHLVSPASALLFTRGMSESGMIDSLPTAFSVNYSSTFASTRLNCTDVTGPTTQLECLRGLKAETVLLAQLQQNTEDLDLGGSYWFGQTCFQPTIDGTGGSIPENPRLLFAAGKINAGIDAFGAGTTSDEGTEILPVSVSDWGVINQTSFRTVVAFSMSKHGVPLTDLEMQQVLDMYPCDKVISANIGANCTQALVDLITDAVFTCGTRFALRAAAAAHDGNMRAYNYHWDYRGHHNPSQSPGVVHSSELPFVFGNDMGWLGGTAFEPAEAAFSRKIGAFWRSLAAIGSPNSAVGSPAGGDWPQCNVTSDISIVLKPTLPGGTFGTETGRRAKQCDLWDAIYAGHLHHQ